MIVNVGMITSSPGFRSSAAIATCNATVPLLTAIPYLRPQYAAQSSSNSAINFPEDDTHPVRTHSATYSRSRSPRQGSLTGIILESFLFIKPSIRTLFDFEKNGVLQETKPVSTGKY